MSLPMTILFSLWNMFGDRDKSTKKTALKTIMSIKMIEETLIRDHMVGMIELFNEMKTLEAKINGETKVDVILETLPNSF